ncbi:hypothetical protein OHQ88_05835 [Micromonospora zamorensis]|uniref:Uncharacterized protein n=1 Tax=Micromonospora zamorensis TaxID=709883 RepID=A0ABZ1PJK8_9ACTN
MDTLILLSAASCLIRVPSQNQRRVRIAWSREVSDRVRAAEVRYEAIYDADGVLAAARRWLGPERPHHVNRSKLDGFADLVQTRDVYCCPARTPA